MSATARQAPRLYLHCGLPRTGTSSLQAELARQGDRLAGVGVVYPERWRVRGSDAHYGIAELLEAPARDGGAAVAGFQEILRENSGSTVLISNEALANWLPAAKRASLVELVLAAREVARVTCLWTLRRLDLWAGSMYLHLIETGREAPDPVEYFLGWASGVADVFTGLREIEALGCPTTYLRYDEAGAHQGELLRAVGMPPTACAQIAARLQGGPRRNAGLGERAAAALRANGFELADGPYYGLVDLETAASVRLAALRAAREAGLNPYLDFFEAGL